MVAWSKKIPYPGHLVQKFTLTNKIYAGVKVALEAEKRRLILSLWETQVVPL
jgi:hypothetical protein